MHVPLPSKPFAEGRKAVITNKFNFDNVDNPFRVHDMTLGSVKLESIVGGLQGNRNARIP